MVLYQVIIIFAFCDVIMKCATTNTSNLEVTTCYDNSSSFEMVTNKPKLVDVITGSVVHLWCHFCDAKGDYYPRWWFYKPRDSKKQKEILSEIEHNDFSTKVIITPVHTLNIRDFNVNNSGIYTCTSPEIMKNGNVFMYILEGVMNVEISPKVGTSTQWLEYKRNYFDSINKKIKISEDEPFKSLRRNSNKTFELATVWENWGKCNEIDHQKGVRKRMGRCRLQPSAINTIFEIMPVEVVSNTAAMSYLTDGYDIPCRSLLLNRKIPKLSEIIRNIPDFKAEETCHVIKRVKHKLNKHKTTKQVEENGHVTLSCTEAVSNSDLKWYRDAKLLNSLFRNNIKCKNEEEPHISVDNNNSLHIVHISKNEEGNYSCVLDGKKVQEFEVAVVSKSKLLNQEFIRYSLYLGFVLLLAMTCYCAGIRVAWHRRSSFVDPLIVNSKGFHEYHHLQSEREKLLK